METLFVRLKPYDPRRGHVIQRYIFGGIKFQVDRGWYRVTRDTAETLRGLHQCAYDDHSPAAFDICTLQEAQRLDAEELEPQARRRRASEDMEVSVFKLPKQEVSRTPFCEPVVFPLEELEEGVASDAETPTEPVSNETIAPPDSGRCASESESSGADEDVSLAPSANAQGDVAQVIVLADWTARSVSKTPEVDASGGSGDISTLSPSPSPTLSPPVSRASGDRPSCLAAVLPEFDGVSPFEGSDALSRVSFAMTAKSRAEGETHDGQECSRKETFQEAGSASEERWACFCGGGDRPTVGARRAGRRRVGYEPAAVSELSGLSVSVRCGAQPNRSLREAASLSFASQGGASSGREGLGYEAERASCQDVEVCAFGPDSSDRPVPHRLRRSAVRGSCPGWTTRAISIKWSAFVRI